MAYQDGRYRVAEGDGNLWSVKRRWEDGVGLVEARAEGWGLAPADAPRGETSVSEAGATVDLYLNEILRRRFPDGDWTGGRPGNFIVTDGGYGTAPGIDEVTRMVVAIGNNP